MYAKIQLVQADSQYLISHDIDLCGMPLLEFVSLH